MSEPRVRSSYRFEIHIFFCPRSSAMKAAAEAIVELARDPRYVGATSVGCDIWDNSGSCRSDRRTFARAGVVASQRLSFWPELTK